jgi:hypothetical protein
MILFHLKFDTMAFLSTLRNSSSGVFDVQNNIRFTAPSVFAGDRNQGLGAAPFPGKMPALFFKTNIHCTMNALYLLASNTVTAKKTMLLGLVASGIFIATSLNAQVIEPSVSAQGQKQDVQNVSNGGIIPVNNGSVSGSPTPNQPGENNPLNPFEDKYTQFLNASPGQGQAETQCDCPGNLLTNPSFENGM